MPALVRVDVGLSSSLRPVISQCSTRLRESALQNSQPKETGKAAKSTFRRAACFLWTGIGVAASRSWILQPGAWSSDSKIRVTWSAVRRTIPNATLGYCCNSPRQRCGNATQCRCYQFGVGRWRLHESPRLSRRLQLLRGWSHEQIIKVFSGGPLAGDPAGARAPKRAQLAMGRDQIDQRQDWLQTGDTAAVGASGRAWSWAAARTHDQ